MFIIKRINNELDLKLISEFENLNKEVLKQLSSFNFGINENDLYLENIMFQTPKLESYKKEEIRKLFLSNIYKMNSLFAGCSSLKYLPNISKWNIENTTDISFMFAGCTSLICLPYISNWNTQNITDMNCLFYNCSSLKSLPDISKWNINNVNDIIILIIN